MRSPRSQRKHEPRLLAERTARAKKAERRFEFLSQANAALSASTDLKAILGTTLRLAVPAVADWCFLDVVSGRRAIVERLAAAYADPEDHAGENLVLQPENSYALEPEAPHGTARVMRNGAAELLPEASNEVLRNVASSQQELETLENLAPASYLCVPLRVGGRMLGSIGFAVRRDRLRYGEDDLLLAEGLAHTTAIALDNARQHEDEEGLTRKLYDLLSTDRQAAPGIQEPKKHSLEAPELTARQAEILTLLAEGSGVNEISQDLYLSKATVRNHIRALLQAFGAHSQLEAVARARKLGLVL